MVDKQGQIEEAKLFRKKVIEVFDGIGLFPRRCELDIYLVAFARRAVRLHEAIIDLHEKSFDGEADILIRALCEIWIVLRWITNRDIYQRAERYARFEAKLVDHLMAILPRHSPSLVVPRHTNHETIATAAAEYTSRLNWANANIRQMAEEQDTIDRLPSGTPADATVFYDLYYCWHSCYVHSNAFGTRGLTPRVGRPASLRETNPDYADQDGKFAIFLSSAYVTLIFTRLGQVWSLDIGGRIDPAWKAVACACGALP